MKPVALSTHHFPFHPISEEVLNMVKRAGFDEIELWGMVPHFDYRDRAHIRKLASLLKRTWLRVSSVHLPFYTKVDRDPNKRGKFYISDSNERDRRRAVEEVLKCIEAADYLGAEVCVLHTGMEFYRSTSDAMRRSIEEILREAEKRGLKIALENGFRERTGIRDVYVILKNFDSPYLGLCIDVGHLNIEGEWEFLKTIPYEKVFELHIVDNDGREDMHLPPYEGNVPWEVVYEVIRSSQANSVIETGPVYEDSRLAESILVSGKRAGSFYSAVSLSEEEYNAMKRRSELLLFESKGTLIKNFIPMKGDASIRSYFRVWDEKGDSYVIMRIPTEAGDEEKVETQKPSYMLNSYKDVYSYFNKHRIPVPEVYSEDGGYFLISDEGEWILEDHFLIRKDDLNVLYEQAISILLNIQSLEKGNCIAYSRRFGIETLRWEMEHFIEYGVSGFGFDANNGLRDELYNLCEHISKMAYVFCHRDFHSKNIIVKDGRLILVDFQDALLAPPHYDLASLVFDSYTDFDDEFMEHLIETYYVNAVQKNVLKENREDFQKNLLQNALHRNLKAFGRFIYIYREKKNPYHLRYLIPTIRKAIMNARRLNLKSTVRLLEVIYAFLLENGILY